MRPTSRTALAALATVAVLATACGDPSTDGADTAAAPEGAAASGEETGAPTDEGRPTAAEDGIADTEDPAADTEDEPTDPQVAATVGVEGSGGDLAFAPDELRVATGETVTFTNDGDAAHTVSGGGLNSGRLEPGDTDTVTLDEPGEIAYLWYFHPSMTGTITVD